MVSRRQFITNGVGALGGLTFLNSGCIQSRKKRAITPSQPFQCHSLEGGIKITGVDLKFEREPLLSPFGFKGGGTCPNYGRQLVTYRVRAANPDLRKTFALNALVSADNTLWLLYAKEKHEKLAAIPLISYNVSPEEIRKEMDKGYFFMKIKIGQAGTQQEMLEKDKQRLHEIHSILKDIRTPYTRNGKLPYYFDANGRYETKELFNQLLDYAEEIKAFDQIVMIEEPFPENLKLMYRISRYAWQLTRARIQIRTRLNVSRWDTRQWHSNPSPRL